MNEQQRVSRFEYKSYFFVRESLDYHIWENNSVKNRRM